MSSINDRIDELEAAMQGLPPAECPVEHNFIPGFYIRTVRMPAGSLITSQIHNSEHPYHVSKGITYVKINEGGWERIEAPYSGVTFPSTRRVLYNETDVVFSTFHQIDESEQPAGLLEEQVLAAVEKIGERIILPHVNKLLGGTMKQNKLIKANNDEIKFY